MTQDVDYIVLVVRSKKLVIVAVALKQTDTLFMGNVLLRFVAKARDLFIVENAPKFLVNY